MSMKHNLPPKKNLSLPRSFSCALAGIWTAFLRERNLRIHFGVALVAIYAGFRFSLSRAEWAGLLLAVSLVLVCELFNSAIEHLVDYASEGEAHPLAGAVKDIAAGAVLLSVIAAVGTGIALFWNPEKLSALFWDSVAAPVAPMVVLVVAFLIARLPDRVRKSLEEEEERKKNRFPPEY